MDDIITIDELSPQYLRPKIGSHKGVAKLDVIAQDYANSQITDFSWARDTHITNYLSLLIDVEDVQDTVAFTAPELIQRLTKENMGDRIRSFITNLKSSTVKLFIVVCMNQHWTFFYFNKNSATLDYYDPLNGGPPGENLIAIGRIIITEAFGLTEIHFRIIIIPSFLKQIDNYNCGFYCIFYIQKLVKNEPLEATLNFNILQIRNKIKEIFEEITEKCEIPYEKFGTIKTTTSVQKENTPKIDESDNIKNDTCTVMHYKNSQKRTKSHSPVTHVDEQGPSTPKKPSLFNLSLMPRSNINADTQKNNFSQDLIEFKTDDIRKTEISASEDDTLHLSPKDLSSKRLEATRKRIAKKEKRKNLAKERGEASAKAKKFRQTSHHDPENPPIQILQSPLKTANYLTPPNIPPFKPSGASSLPPKLSPMIKANEKKKSEERLIEDLRNVVSIVINENIELKKSKEELTENLINEKRKSTEYANINRNLSNKLERRVLHIPLPKSLYPTLTSQGKGAVAVRIKKLLEENNPLYTEVDWNEILKKAFPGLLQQFCFNPEETAEFQLQSGLTRRKMEKVRKMFKNKCGWDVFASRKAVALFRKNLKNECVLTFFDEEEIVGAVLSDVVEAITIRVRRQKKSGTFTLNANEKLPICIVEDKGDAYTSIGIILGSLLKRNSPDATLFCGIYKGNESRRNLIIAFDGSF
uniref:Ubiquitin-like protease family profile domain-containing protein n=1 Tax=Panagrolaimus superbus TaxID=310955 RepID=A0A914XWQ8_9BILA